MKTDLVYLSWTVEGTSVVLALPGGGKRRLPARPFLETLIEAQENLQSHGDLASSLGELGNVLSAEGNWFRAISVLQRAVALFLEAGDVQGASKAQCNLGIAHMEVSDPVAATSSLQQSVTHAREVGDRRLEADGLWNLAIVTGRAGDVLRACTLGEKAVAIFERLGDQFAGEARLQLEIWKRY